MHERVPQVGMFATRLRSMSKPQDLPMQIAKAFLKDMRAYHVEHDAIERAEIVQRRLDALQRFQGPRDKPLRFRDIPDV
jgi:hypothetical protein